MNTSLTIFTPVFNRAYIISTLYKSLCQQTSHDFEWLIVDDGSTDNIKELIDEFIQDGKINIRFFRQKNGGKHRAINRGLKEASGELFFIVDSDDYLKQDAVDWIKKNSDEILNNPTFAGISGLRVSPNGEKIGGGDKFTQIDTDAIRIRTVYGVRGDLAEIYKTKILKKYPFPEITGEKFCSEGLIWNRIAMSGLKLRYCYKPLYVCEYLGDGLTAGRVKCRIESPEYSMLLYSEAINNPSIPFKTKIKYGLLFWRYSGKSKKSFGQKAKMIPTIYIPLLFPAILLRKLNR